MKKRTFRKILFVLIGFALLSLDAAYLRADQDATANDFQQKQKAALNARKVNRQKPDSASVSAVSFTRNPAAGAIIRDTATVTEANSQQVIIHGKWGTGPGEFGGVYDMPISGTDYMPTDINFNSKSEIYILDVANARIQKFDKNGKYILSIPVECMNDENGHYLVYVETAADTGFDVTKLPSTVADDLVMDKNDVLYYSFTRNYDTEQAKEEVWEIRNDKVVKKYTDLPIGDLEIGEDGSVWLTWGDLNNIGHDKYYNVFERKLYTDIEFNDKGHPIDYSRLKKDIADRYHKRGFTGRMSVIQSTDYLRKGYRINIDSKNGVDICKIKS